MSMGLGLARNLGRIVVVGRDVDLWLSACTLKRALPDCALEVIELPSSLREGDVYISHPPLEGLHKRLGIQEHMMLAATGGCYNLGYSCANFAGPESEFFVPHGDHGHDWEDQSFFTHWLRASASGMTIPISEFSLNAAAAYQGRFFISTAETAAFQQTDYAYVMRAPEYVDLLKQRTLSLGVPGHATRDVDIVCGPSGQVTHIRLRDGKLVSCDLVIDASGSERVVAGAIDDCTWEDWRPLYPFNRRVTIGANAVSPLPAYTQVKALSVGTLSIVPVQCLTNLTLEFDSRLHSDSEMAEAALVVAGMSQATNAVADDMQLGRQVESWNRNVVALGESFVGLDGLGAPALHILQMGIIHLLAALAAPTPQADTRNAFNRKMMNAALSARDFQLCHYRLNAAGLGGNWEEMARRPVPPSVAARLDRYTRQAVMPQSECDILRGSQWIALLAGMHLLPEPGAAPIGTMPEAVDKMNIVNALHFIREQVEAMHSHDAYLEIHAPYTRALGLSL